MAKRTLRILLCAGLAVGVWNPLKAELKQEDTMPVDLKQEDVARPELKQVDIKETAANIISINPIELLVGLLDGQYELRLNEGSSLCLRANYWNFKLGDWDYTAFGGGAAYRMYFKHTALKGVYWGAFIGFASAQSKYDNTWSEGSVSLTAISPGLEFGNQWIWDSGFALDLGISASYSTTSPVTVKLRDKTTGEDTGQSSTVNGFTGFGYGLRLALGYAF